MILMSGVPAKEPQDASSGRPFLFRTHLLRPGVYSLAAFSPLALVASPCSPFSNPVIHLLSSNCTPISSYQLFFVSDLGSWSL